MSEPLRVLMVEDQQDLRELIGQALQDFGIEIHTADDGPAALRLMQDPGGFDVVFSDISMPNGMSGVELQARLKASGNPTPLIFITAFPEDRVRRQVTAAGAIGFLSKPFDGSDMIACLDMALGGHA